MELTNPNPPAAALEHGPLTGQDLSLLAPGKSVLQGSGSEASPALPVAGVGSPAPSEAAREAVAQIIRECLHLKPADETLGGLDRAVKRVLAAITPASGKAVAWTLRWPDGQILTAHSFVSEAAAQSWADHDGRGATVQPLAVIAAPAPDAGVEG